MPIDSEHEYNTLRQEMLQRFDRIHDTAKYGTGAFIAFLSYSYSNPNLDNFVAFAILQLPIILIGMSSLRLYRSIYNVGTYIAVIIEGDSKAKWHRMSRQLDSYAQQHNNKKWFWRLPFPLGKRWGEDSAQLGILLIALMIIGLGAVLLRPDTLSAPLPLCTLQWLPLVIVIALLICNVILIYQLVLGIRNYRNNVVETWKKYRSSFGKDFPDKYTDCQNTEF